MHKPQTKKLE